MSEHSSDLFKGLPTGERKKSDYKWQSDKTKMLRMLRNSKTLKEKNGWSRKVGAGFIVDDIMALDLLENKSLVFEFGWGRQTFKVGDLNLRETEETIKFLEGTGDDE